jgi:RNA polymerase sigma-70 factor (ECF subfamily)
MKLPVQDIMGKYKNNIYATAFSICADAGDAEDVVQETFIQYYMTHKNFESEQHIKAWLLRVAINKSKNICSSFWRRNRMPLEEYVETLTFETEQSKELFEEVMKLPDKYRVVMHLFYYEDYSVKEIADILKVTESNVKVRLSRARSILKEKLKEGWEDEQ